MLDIKVTVCKDQKELNEVFDEMDRVMHEYTMRAARGQCGWICASCCGFDHRGMPDECMYGHQDCTDIITRDKLAAQK